MVGIYSPMMSMPRFIFSMSRALRTVVQQGRLGSAVRATASGSIRANAMVTSPILFWEREEENGDFADRVMRGINSGYKIGLLRSA
jgi:hypothetical protein